MIDKKVVAGIDIGGTKIAVLIQTCDEKTISSFRVPTEEEMDPRELLERVLDKIETKVIETDSRLMTVGIGCPGPLDIEKGLVLSPTNLPRWIDFPLVEIVRERLNVPTILDNDANAAALGEFYYGTGHDFNNVLYVTVSTGIGGAIIYGGEIYHGVGASAGEIGHTIVKHDGLVCLCGTKGCLETISSGKSLARRMRERIAAGEKSVVSEMVENCEEVTTQIIVEAVKRGDELACAVWDEGCRFLGIGIANAITILAPDAVIIGGGVAQSGDVLFEPLKSYIRQNVSMLPIEEVSILQASLGGESGVLGAAKMAHQQLGSQVVVDIV